MNKEKKKILVVCHDAGGAEVVSAYVKKNLAGFDFICLAPGPADKIFRKKGLENYLVSDNKKAESVLASTDELITGTSWGSSVELDFIKLAKEKKVKTISYLDHWVNYRDRFGYPREDWETNLPDEIWVGDRHAYDLANEFFKNITVTMVENEYFAEIKQEYKDKIKEVGAEEENVLLISEPLTSDVNSFGDKSVNTITEFDILRDIFQYLKENKFKKKIIFRLHPAEEKNKYDKLLAEFYGELDVEKSENQDIYADFSKCSTVIGMESMALVLAYQCGKKVVSYIPIKDKECPLPFEGIIKIKNLDNLVV